MLSAFSRRLKCCLYAVSVLYVVRSQGLHKKKVIQENHLAWLSHFIFILIRGQAATTGNNFFISIDVREQIKAILERKLKKG